MGASQSAVRRRWLSLCTVWSSSGLVSRQWDTVDWAFLLCMIVALRMTERADQLPHDSAPAHSKSLVQDFLAKHRITQVCQPNLEAGYGLLRILAFLKTKIAVENKEICECDGHTVHKLSQTASHCRLTSPTVQRLYTDAQQGLLWLAATSHQSHATGSRVIRNGWILSGQPSYYIKFQFLHQRGLCPSVLQTTTR
jgi:hypothetical protein